MKVRIKQLPKKAYGGQQPAGALDVRPSSWSGSAYSENARLGKEVKKTLTKVPRKEANLEAEGGETAFGPISGDTIPDHMTITGPRHTNGGVPLKLPEDTFIFSDTKSMRIKDPKILKMFGKTKKKGGYTPAELAKPYDINKYKAILADPDSDRMDRENAELMIKNFIMKLGALAIAQESKKGFPQGIPEMARPYMEANGISDEDLLPKTKEEQMPQEGQMPPQEEMEYGGAPKYPHGGDFHPPASFEERMQQTLNADINIGSPESVLGKADAKSGIYTPENPYVNPLTGKSPPVMGDGKGGLAFTKQPEKSEDKEFTIEHKINDSSQLNFEEAANQGALLAGLTRDIGLGLKAGQREASQRNNYFDQKDLSSQSVKRGINMANTPGVSYSSQPTTVQGYMSQFGGALDRFVYGGEEPMAYGGSQELTYGGTPMSLYGMEMGGSYYPTMSTGGTRRVKITGLPRKDNGGDGNDSGKSSQTYETATETTQEKYDAATEADGWKTITDDQGRTYKVLYKDGVEKKRVFVDKESLADEIVNKGSYGMADVCSWVNDPKSHWYNASYTSLSSGPKAVIADTPENKKAYEECTKVEGGSEKVDQAIKVVDDPKDCGCPEVDADGNIVKNEDGSNKLIATGEQAVYNEETKKWECPPCDYEGGGGDKVEEEVDDVMWSDTATRNAVTQALFRTDAERMDPELVDRPDGSPVLKRRYDEDLFNQLTGMRRNLNAAGLTGQQAIAANLSALGKMSDAVGGRQKDTEDYNKNVLNQFAQFDVGTSLKQAALNQNALNRARMLNLSQGDKETAAGNQKLQNMNRAAMDADREVLDKATWNFKNPDFQIDYKTGLPYKDISYKEPNPTKSTDILTQYQNNLSELGEGNEAIAYKLARDQVYGQTSKFGGSVKSSSFIPTYKTMPYGN